MKTLIKLYDSRKFDDDQVHNELLRMVTEMNTYQRPTSEKVDKYNRIKDVIIDAMMVILEDCPPCEDRLQAINMLRDVRMKANSAIALDGEF
jgi:hypothetical protein